MNVQKSITHTRTPCTSANRYYCCKNDVTQWGVEHQYICSTYNRPCFGDAARRQEPKIYGFQSIIFKNKNLFIKGHISPKQCLQNLIETFENYLKKQYLYSTTTECVCALSSNGSNEAEAAHHKRWLSDLLSHRILPEAALLYETKGIILQARELMSKTWYLLRLRSWLLLFLASKPYKWMMINYLVRTLKI